MLDSKALFITKLELARNITHKKTTTMVYRFIIQLVSR